MEKCLSCGKEFKTLKGLHTHVKVHGGMESYYQTHYPRFDLYDNTVIKFKDKDQYMNAYFNSNSNRQKFYEDARNSEKAKELVINEIKNNAKFKDYSFLPSENYLLLSGLPNIGHIQRLYGSCLNMCERSKFFEPLFTKRLPKEFWGEEEFKGLDILVDTREQKPFNIENVIYSKLDFGDYTSTSHYNKVFVERKSIPDFVSSMGGGAERFEKELKRAEEFDSYIVMVVEGTVEEARQYCYKSPKHRRPNIDYSLHNLRGFLIQFARNFQVLFCDNRFEAQDMTKRILYFGEYIKNCDLQYGLDQRKARV